jgi:DNA modification methylase
MLEPANYDGRKDTMMKGSDKYESGFVPGQSEQSFHSRGHERWREVDGVKVRTRRSVWTVPTNPYSGAHFAVFPPALIEPMVLASTRIGDIVLDPFMGSGTTAQVAQDLGRN